MRSRSQRYRPSSQSSSVQLKARCVLHLKGLRSAQDLQKQLAPKEFRARGSFQLVFFNVLNVGCQQEEEGDV